MREKSQRVPDRAEPGQPWPYTAVLEYCVDQRTLRHVICAQTVPALQGAFSAVNSDLQELDDGFYDVHIAEAVIKGPSGKERKLKVDKWGLFSDGVAPREVFDAIRFLEMN